MRLRRRRNMPRLTWVATVSELVRPPELSASSQCLRSRIWGSIGESAASKHSRASLLPMTTTLAETGTAHAASKVPITIFRTAIVGLPQPQPTSALITENRGRGKRKLDGSLLNRAQRGAVDPGTALLYLRGFAFRHCADQQA